MGQVGKDDCNKDRELLASMAHRDIANETHDPESCGTCYIRKLHSEVAAEMLKQPECSIKEWSDETQRRWEAGKYYKLYVEELEAGRDPKVAFEKLGWDM